MIRNVIRSLVVIQIAAFLALPSTAQAPRVLTLNATLRTAAGQPVNNFAQAVTFRLYTTATGGTPVYTELRTVSVVSGQLAVCIGSGNPGAFGALSFNVPYWVGVSVGADAEMTPRLPLGSSPYARLATDLPVDATLLAKASGGVLTSAGGLLGVGTANPAAMLDVNGGAAVRGTNALELGAGVSGKEPNAGKIGYQTFSSALDIVGAGSTSAARTIRMWGEGGTVFTGPVGVQTDSPQAPLHVKGNAGLLNLEGSDHAYIQFYPQGFNAGRKAYIGFPGAGSADLVISNEFHLFDNFPGDFIYMSTRGYIGIDDSTPGYQLQVNGLVAGAGNYVNASDVRYKRDIATYDNALRAILSLRGVTFQWRKEEFPKIHFQNGRQIGFIAQEVENVLPEVVHTDSAGYKSIAYGDVVPVLVEAVKEEHARISARDARISALERGLAEQRAQNAALAARLARLEQTAGR